MKRGIVFVQIAVLIIEMLAVVLLGLEVYGHMNPDNIMLEAIIIGICLLVNLICVFYKLYTEKK